MNRAQIIHTQTVVGATPDGFWGPKSITACQKHLRSLMPSPNPWPKSDQKSLTAFYGDPGDESRHIRINVVGMGVRYAGKEVKEILCHNKVSRSLLKIITSLASSHPHILAQYDGCYNNRAMRGGTTPSLHARAAAIDFDSSSNGNKTSWPVSATMPIEVMEAFAREGWLSAGAFWGRDAMHMQATQ